MKRLFARCLSILCGTALLSTSGIKWLRDHPEDLQRWLTGGSSFNRKDGVATVQAS
jgi:hypothetical protein